MYPEQNKQRGSALVIAVFIIVVMLALVLSLSRLLTSGSEAIVYEVQGTRALFAAQSGLEISLSELFFLASTTCPFTKPAHEFSVPGLQGCSATVSCAEPYVVESITVYQLESVGQCAAVNGEVTSRKVQIEVR